MHLQINRAGRSLLCAHMHAYLEIDSTDASFDAQLRRNRSRAEFDQDRHGGRCHPEKSFVCCCYTARSMRGFVRGASCEFLQTGAHAFHVLHSCMQCIMRPCLECEEVGELVLLRDQEFADGPPIMRDQFPLVRRAESALDDVGMIAAFNCQFTLARVRLALSKHSISSVNVEQGHSRHLG